VKLIVDLAVAAIGDGGSRNQRSQLQQRLKDGSAWKKFVALVYAQDGDATTLEKILDVHRAPVVRPLPAKSAGVIKKMDAELIGRASVLLGAGRQKTGDTIDFAVGFSQIKKTGEHVDLKEPLLVIHARDEESLESVLPILAKATVIG
jgi:thymidine phosphorylase